MMARVSSLYIRLALVTVACGTLVYIISFNSVNPFSEYAVSAFARYSRNPTNDRISYDLTSPPAHTCAATVTRLQQQLIAAYAPILKGISYVNLWGYLETGNKGDAAIWSAQQILLSTFGIETMEVCRFIDKCNMTRFKGALEAHQGHSAIIMAGGGNFNDYYWLDQPSRLKMSEWFRDYPIRAFPQSIYMTKEKTIKKTIEIFSAHPDLQLAARDQPSFDWLEQSFGPNEANGQENSRVLRTLTPDVVYAFGNRPDYISTASPKKYDILFNSRNDQETSHLNTSSLIGNSGAIKLGRHMVRWAKVNWDTTPVDDLRSHKGYNERAFLKYDAGFKLHGEAELVVTDKLHGHIVSTLIGVPHILLNSKLGKNLAYHDTWTLDCENTRIAENIDQTMEYARMFFEQEFNQGRWKPSVEDTAA